MSKSANNHTTVQPRATIHKRILDVAQDRPQASMAEIADDVSGATVSLVERALEEYGDPGESVSENDPLAETTGTKPAQQTPTEDNTDSEQEVNIPESLELSKPQRETLVAIRDNPEATQRDLAEILDISQSTVNHRLSSVSGFDWDTRTEFVTNCLEEMNSTENTTKQSVNSSQESDKSSRSVGREATVGVERDAMKHIENRLDQIEHRLAEITSPQQGPVEDTELIHKMIQACVRADTVTEEEERRIIRSFVEQQ